MPEKEVFKLSNLLKSYEGKRALSLSSLKIKKGERVALIGPSGAGKTTLLNLMANTIKADRGEILIDGIPMAEYGVGKQLHKKVGILRQQFDLVGQLAVIHNVLAGRLGEWGFFKSLLSLFVPQDEKVAVKALKRVGLEDRVYERTSKLSGGEQQRVALARLLVQHPEVILADEPVASLDPARAEDILQVLVKLAREEEQTLIASLHSVEYAKKYFSRIISLRDGEIYFDLPPEKVSSEDLDNLYSLKEMK